MTPAFKQLAMIDEIMEKSALNPMSIVSATGKMLSSGARAAKTLGGAAKTGLQEAGSGIKNAPAGASLKDTLRGAGQTFKKNVSEGYDSLTPKQQLGMQAAGHGLAAGGGAALGATAITKGIQAAGDRATAPHKAKVSELEAEVQRLRQTPGKATSGGGPDMQTRWQNFLAELHRRQAARQQLR